MVLGSPPCKLGSFAYLAARGRTRCRSRWGRLDYARQAEPSRERSRSDGAKAANRDAGLHDRRRRSRRRDPLETEAFQPDTPGDGGTLGTLRKWSKAPGTRSFLAASRRADPAP